MAYLSPIKPGEWQSRETATRQAGSADFLLSYVAVLKAQPGTRAVAQSIAEQVHTRFYPLAAALIAEEDGRLSLVGFASQNEQSDRGVIEQDLGQPYGSLTDAVRRALYEDRAAPHAVDLSDTSFQ